MFDRCLARVEIRVGLAACLTQTRFSEIEKRLIVRLERGGAQGLERFAQRGFSFPVCRKALDVCDAILVELRPKTRLLREGCEPADERADREADEQRDDQ